MPKKRSFLGELLRRKVVRQLGGYIAILWLLAQGFASLFPYFGLPDSAHLLNPRTTARMLHTLAANDDAQAPQVKEVLARAYRDAGIKAEIEVYNAQHGWCSLDSAVYDGDEAERAHGRLLALFETALA